MFANLLLLLLGVGVSYFIYLYISWRILYYKTLWDPEIPLSTAHFLPTLIPFSNYFGVPDPKTKADIVIQTAKKHNKPYVSMLIGFKKFIVLTLDKKNVKFFASDFELIHEICIKKSRIFEKPLEVYSILHLFGPNVLTTIGDEWKHQRILFNPVFTQETYLKFVFDSTVKCSKKLMDVYLKDDINEIKLKKPLSHLALDVLSTSVFGFDANSLDPIAFENYKKEEIPNTVSMTFVDSLMNSIAGLVLKHFVPRAVLKLPFFDTQKNSVHDFQEYSKFILEKSRLNETKENTQDSLVKLMVKSQDGENNIQLTDRELISNMFIFFFAGHETTAGTLHWAILKLATHPKVQDKLYQEVNELLQGRDPVYDDYPQLQYSQAVLKETLRMHSPVKSTVKKNIEKTTLNGVEFPKDTVFQMHMQAVHFDENLWENPREFQPERFLKKYNPAHFMPFSYGKRNCIGSKFAEIEATTVLTILIQHYSIHLKDGIDPSKYEEEVQFVTATQKHDCPYILKKRSKTSQK